MIFMRLFKSLSLVCCVLLFVASTKADDEIKAVQLYSQDELLDLINKNEHLSRVVSDNCQLVQQSVFFMFRKCFYKRQS